MKKLSLTLLGAEFVGFEIECEYGLSNRDDLTEKLFLSRDKNANRELIKEMYHEGKKHWKSLRNIKATYTETLKPGTWTDVDLILVPSKAEELGYIKLSLETPIIRLAAPATQTH